MRDSFDAIIVGGGLAGSLCAALLSLQNWSVAVIERAQRNRSKTCGHCLSSRSFSILQKVNVLGAVRGIAVGRTDRLRAYLPNRPPVELPLNAHADDGLLVERSAFDQLLLDHARSLGAAVYQPARAQSIERSGNRSTLHLATTHGESHELEAPLIIGADGLRSRVAQWFGVGHRTGRKYGFSLDFNEHRVRDCARPQTSISMFILPGAYLGAVFQSNGKVHIAALVDARSRGHGAHNPARICGMFAKQYETLRPLELALNSAQVGNLTAAGPMPCIPHVVAGDGFALVGDASGYVEPFTGEGMTWAAESASALAEALAEVKPGEWNCDAANRYIRCWKHAIGRPHRRCSWIAWALERPRITALARAAAQRQPALAEHIARRVVAA